MEGLGRRVYASGLRVAVAESLTCGRLANTIGAAPEAAAWFPGGVVAYQSHVKQKVLGVEPGIDPCSAACAEQLAEGVRRLLEADIALSTTGVGGPDPEDGHPPGTVYIGWATARESGHRLLRLDGEPDEIIDDTVDAAISLLLGLLDDSEVDGAVGAPS